MGSQEWHKGSFPPIIYTDGPKLVADTCGAYWLIDVIASWQPELRRKNGRFPPFQVWHLTKEYDKKEERDFWIIRCWSDTPGKSTRLAYQKIPYSDFPDELLPFTMWVEGGTIILPAEH